MTPRALPIPSLSFPSVRPAPDSSDSIASLRFPRLSSSPAANVPRQCQSMRCQSNQTLTADSVDVDSLAKCFDQNHHLQMLASCCSKVTLSALTWVSCFSCNVLQLWTRHMKHPGRFIQQNLAWSSENILSLSLAKTAQHAPTQESENQSTVSCGFF